MEKALFEQMGGTYTQVGDYLLPDVELPVDEKPIGVWGHTALSPSAKSKPCSFQPVDEHR